MKSKIKFLVVKYGTPSEELLACLKYHPEVVVVCVTGNTVYGHATTTRQNPNRVAVIHSTDGGRTWSHPAEITESI